MTNKNEKKEMLIKEIERLMKQTSDEELIRLIYILLLKSMKQ